MTGIDLATYFALGSLIVAGIISSDDRSICSGSMTWTDHNEKARAS